MKRKRWEITREVGMEVEMAKMKRKRMEMEDMEEEEIGEVGDGQDGDGQNGGGRGREDGGGEEEQDGNKVMSLYNLSILYQFGKCFLYKLACEMYLELEAFPEKLYCC